jgi:DNA-binding transcriptional ArsR family regulator
MVKSDVRQLDRIFHALSDPTRRSILEGLTRNERTVTQIAARYPMSLAAVSKHLKVLEHAKLIGRRKAGSFRFLKLRAESLLSAAEWIAHYEQFWGARLDVLKSFLERGTR